MISVILCAAGRGERAGFRQNKILQEFNGMPVLCYSLSAFSACAEIGEILVTVSPCDERQIAALLGPYPNARTVSGGATRFESVLSALNEAKGETVLIHDAARPFVTQKIISDCIASVNRFGSGVCALPATDTTVLAEDGMIKSVPARAEVFTVQTPQGFDTAQLRSAYEKAKTCGGEFTDESGVFAKFVSPPKLFIGDPCNRKLTYPEDFTIAERVGTGVDTHAFYTEGEGSPFINFITLCGVRVPSDQILKAHSDGDVAVHALMDALLSAAGLRDIGYYFPDSEPKYKNADSMQLLSQVIKRIRNEGFAPENVSISILAETPRLAPYIDRMKATLAQHLNLPLSAIGIAAGTNEKLGYVGEKKGITCFTTVLLKKVTL